MSTTNKAHVRRCLLADLRAILPRLLPGGYESNGRFIVGDIQGNAGNSMDVMLDGPKAGLWIDRATDERGDIFALIAAHYNLNVRSDFPKVLVRAQELCGMAKSNVSAEKPTRKRAVNLGPVTAQWNYLSPQGQIIAVVSRYDPPGLGKEFRPWDAERKRYTTPVIRPLYNLPGVSVAQQVVLVEGEKCAQALIDLGITATTAMQGAMAPVDKTDWTPLAGKSVIIWPDNDVAGQTYAESALNAIVGAGAASCVILPIPMDKAPGWDVADAVAEGFGKAEVSDFLSQSIPDVVPVFEIDGVSEDVLAIEFRKVNEGSWRYCAAWDKWFVWNGSRWMEDVVLGVNYEARLLCREAADVAKNKALKRKLGAANTIAAVVRLAKADPWLATKPEQWDADPWLLNTTANTIDLHTGAVRESNRNDLITKEAAATLGSSCPLWEQFLFSVCNRDLDLVDYLQRVIGYCLTGVTTEHAIFFCMERGRMVSPCS